MLDTIKQIAEAKGNDKLVVMAKYPQMKDIFKYAYDPFMKYYMSAPQVEGNIDGHFFETSVWELLDDLASRELSGQASLEAVSDMIVSMYPDDAEVFKMILNKDLRCGINIKTINKVWPGLIPLVWDGSKKPDIMLLRNFVGKKAKWPMMIAVKKDGVRGRCVGNMLSRQGHKLIGHDHIEDELSKCPHDFDGELCVPGCGFDEASGLIRNNEPTPNSVYHVFDVPSVPGTKEERYLWLLNNLVDTDCVKLIKQQFYYKTGAMKFYDDSVKAGEEGIVIYDPDSLYEDKRSFDWMRLVPLKTADCVVIGFYEGKGKHAGSLGGIIVDYKGHEVRVGTGFKEKMAKKDVDLNTLSISNPNLKGTKYQDIIEGYQNIRQYIWGRQDIFKGAIAECEFKEETKAGSMRQPRFKRWRWDKI